MIMLINETISSILQVLLFTAIPFFTWLFTARKRESFFSWIGLKKFNSSKIAVLKFAIVALIVCEIMGVLVYKFVLDTEWNKGASAGTGIVGIPTAILYSYIHTGLSEEILFRGFIQKRLQSKLDFKIATAIQTILFGFAHIVPILNKINFVEGLALVIAPMLPGVLFAYINEKKAEGSIFPSWILHGTMNILLQIAQL